jgi:hypothetical protein
MNHNQRRTTRTRLLIAAITGIAAGISRAVATFILDKLS